MATMGVSRQITEEELKMALQVAKAVRIASPIIMCDLTPSMAKNMVVDSLELEQTVKMGMITAPRGTDSIIYCLRNNSALLTPKSWLLSGKMLLLVGKTNEVTEANNILKLSVGIGQVVYFLDTETGRLTESYNVNGLSISNLLGQASSSNNFVWVNNRDILTRRSNFQGLQLKICSYAIGAPFMHYPNKVREGFNWIRDRKGSLIADVTEVAGFGSFMEVMLMLQSELNFTTSIVVRKDDSFGFPRFVNGTFVGYTGMIGDLLSKDIDVIMAPLQHIYERSRLLDFFHGIGTITISLLVNVNAGNEEQEWLMYLLPFQTSLWPLLFANSLCAALAITLMHFLCSQSIPSFLSLILESVGNFWMVTMSYFGKPPSTQAWKSVHYTKILLLIVFLSGNLVFMSYKAGLTSELAIKRTTLPFSTPEGLYNSKYRYPGT